MNLLDLQKQQSSSGFSEILRAVVANVLVILSNIVGFFSAVFGMLLPFVGIYSAVKGDFMFSVFCLVYTLLFIFVNSELGH